jgi:hypothetical protein
LNISSFETAPAVLGCQVTGSTTLLCGMTEALQFKLAAPGSAGSSDSEKPSCTGTFSAARCCYNDRNVAGKAAATVVLRQ